jgi:hypothetical protein
MLCLQWLEAATQTRTTAVEVSIPVGASAVVLVVPPFAASLKQ